MTERFRKSMETLELPRVLELLAQEAVTQEGKERALELLPETDLPSVDRLQEETAAAFSMLTLHGTPALSGVRPVRASLQRADRGRRGSKMFTASLPTAISPYSTRTANTSATPVRCGR